MPPAGRKTRRSRASARVGLPWSRRRRAAKSGGSSASSSSTWSGSRRSPSGGPGGRPVATAAVPRCRPRRDRVLRRRGREVHRRRGRRHVRRPGRLRRRRGASGPSGPRRPRHDRGDGRVRQAARAEGSHRRQYRRGARDRRCEAGAREAMVTGDVVNTAARLQGAAPVGAVLVGEETYRTTKDAILYSPSPTSRRRGKRSLCPPGSRSTRRGCREIVPSAARSSAGVTSSTSSAGPGSGSPPIGVRTSSRSSARPGWGRRGSARSSGRWCVSAAAERCPGARSRTAKARRTRRSPSSSSSSAGSSRPTASSWRRGSSRTRLRG